MLPGTQQEIDIISNALTSKKWEVDIRSQQTANEEVFKVEIDASILHIATHGIFDSQANEKIDLDGLNVDIDNSLFYSGLILAGGGDLLDSKQSYNENPGILTAYEALNLKLNTVDMVVLSACETGKGKVHDGEGVYGLQRSFLIAGAKCVIMSLNKVPDDVTSSLMSKFYKNWLNGDSYHDALINAKKEIRKQYNVPYYWASFVLIGKD